MSSITALLRWTQVLVAALGLFVAAVPAVYAEEDEEASGQSEAATKAYASANLKAMRSVLRQLNIEFTEQRGMLFFDPVPGQPFHMILSVRPTLDQILIQLRTSYYATSEGHSDAVTWVNGRNRKLIVGRYYVDSDNEIMLDWAIPTQAGGPQVAGLKAVIALLPLVAKGDVSAMKKFARIKTSTSEGEGGGDEGSSGEE